MKVAIIAHEISPKQGSECAAGWNVVMNLAKYNDLELTVFCSIGPQLGADEYKQAITEYFKENTPKSLIFKYIEYNKICKKIASINRFFFGSLSGIGLPFLYYICYRSWQNEVVKSIKSVNQESKFDCIHLLNQITYRQPGRFHKLGIPFFWGPTGGSETISKSFIKSLPIGLRVIEFLRLYVTKFLHIALRNVHDAAKHSSVIYSFTNLDHDFFSNYAITKKMVDAATSIKEVETRKFLSGNVLEILWAGQLIDRKLPFLILDLMKKYPDLEDKVNFRILGSGPRKKVLMKAIEDSELSNIKILDQIPHNQVESIMLKSHFLLHTSYREAGTHIIPEALSTGLPVICHAVGGMNLTINKSNGFKVELISYSHSIKTIAEYLYEVIENPNLVFEKSSGAISFAKGNSWSHMAETFRKDYLHAKK